MKVQAPAVKGKANKEMIEKLARILGLSKSDIFIVSGHKSRTKQVKIKDLTKTDIISRLKAHNLK